MLERAEDMNQEIQDVQRDLINYFDDQQEADSLEQYKIKLEEFIHVAHKTFQQKYFNFSIKQIEVKTRDLVITLRDYR